MADIPEEIKNKIKGILVAFLQDRWKEHEDRKQAKAAQTEATLKQIEDVKQSLYQLY